VPRTFNEGRRKRVKAIRFHGFGPPEIMQLGEVPAPKISTGQIRVPLHSTGVNPFDPYIRSGTYAIKSTAYRNMVLLSSGRRATPGFRPGKFQGLILHFCSTIQYCTNKVLSFSWRMDISRHLKVRYECWKLIMTNCLLLTKVVK
jgi:hypothetical protein